MAIETFANFPSTTVPAGASGTVSSGQADTWVVSSQATFGTAATGVTKFHVADTAQAASSELILVTNMTGAGNTTWSVIRGAENTTPVTHGAGFTITQVIAAGFLNDVATSTLPAGNVTSTKEFLTSTGSGGTANSPVWGTISAGDVPVLNQSTTGTAATAGNVTGTVAVANGGTGLNSLTAYGVIAGGTSATTPVQQVATAGTLGQVLTSQGAGQLPQWANSTGGSSVTFPITVSEGGTGAGSLSTFALVAGGTTSTSPVQQIAAGTSGQVLTGNGAGTLPSFQALQASELTGNVSIPHGGTGAGNAAAAITALTNPQGAGEYLRSDGTNATLSAIQAGDVPGDLTLTGWAETAVGGTIATGTTTSTIAVSSGNVWNLTLSNTATCTFTLTTGTPSGTSSSVTVYLTQDGTGNRTVAWNNVTWLAAAGSQPAIASAAGAVTVLTFETFTAGSTWFGAQITGAPQIPVPLADLPAQAATTLGMFGDGSDGAATLDGTTATSGWASGPTSNVYTLSRDAQLTALQVNSGVTLFATGYRIHCQGQVSISSGGTISVAGHSASGTVAGLVTGSGSNGGGRAGGNGGPAAGTAGSTGSGSPNGAAGGGGAGTGGGAGAAGASTSLPSGWYRLPFPILNGGLYAFTAAQGINGGAGGGGGGGDGTNAGGGGGGGGGLLTIFAYSVVSNGTMTVAGGNGGNGAGSNSGGGGGGAGGAILAYTLIPWNNSGTTIVSGGSAGTGSHANGSAGGSGSSVNIVLV